MFVETPPGLETFGQGPYPDVSWCAGLLTLPALARDTLTPPLCQGGLGFMRERRIWSGFGYRIGLARGLALRRWGIGWFGWCGVLGEMLASANRGRL